MAEEDSFFVSADEAEDGDAPSRRRGRSASASAAADAPRGAPPGTRGSPPRMAVADADASFVDAANSSFEDPPSSERVAGVLLATAGFCDAAARAKAK